MTCWHAEPTVPRGAGFLRRHRATTVLPASPVPATRRPSPALPTTLALIAVACLWGTSMFATKPLLPYLPPTGLALLRVVVALAVLLPLLRRRGERPAWGWVPALLGLTGVVLANVLQNLGLRAATAAEATLILGTGIPVMTVVIATTFLRERLGRRAAAGVAASIVGVVALVALGGRGGEGSAAGGSLVGGGCCSPPPVPGGSTSRSPGAPSSAAPRCRW